MRLPLGVLLLLFACATRPVQPDDMSAAAHRREAAKENRIARHELAAYDPRAVAPVAEGGTYLYPAGVYNPTESHLHASEAHSAHAREHLDAAQALDQFEQDECRDFPPAT